MSRPLSDALNESNPNKLPNAGHDALLGSALQKNPAQFGTFAVASDIATLPDGAKAAQVLSVFVRAGGATGYFVAAPEETTPAAGEFAVNAMGDVEFAAADAVTSAEIVWVPCEGDVITETMQVTASAGTFLQSRRARKLLSVTVDVGVSTGAKGINPRGSAAAAGLVAINTAGTGLVFDAADVVDGSATISYIATPSQGTGVADALVDRLSAAVAY